VEDTHQPIEVVLVKGLLCDLFSHSSYSYGMLVFQFFSILPHSVTIELLVEFHGPLDGLVKPEIIPSLFLRFLAFVA